MAAKLKTFVTSNGLMDFIVATTSKTKALAAWGVGQDLFKFGQAHETDDPALVQAAEAEPGKVIQRPASTQAAIRALQPASMEKKPKLQPPAQPKAEPAARPAAKVIPLRPSKPPPEPEGPTPAQLRKIAEAEEKLAAARATHKETIAGFASDQERLEGGLDEVSAEMARLRKAQTALEKKQARLKGEQEALESRNAQERKRFAAQEAILKARLESAKSVLG